MPTLSMMPAEASSAMALIYLALHLQNGFAQPASNDGARQRTLHDSETVHTAACPAWDTHELVQGMCLCIAWDP